MSFQEKQVGEGGSGSGMDSKVSQGALSSKFGAVPQESSRDVVPMSNCSKQGWGCWSAYTSAPRDTEPPMCAGKAGSGNLNSKSVLASGRPLDEEMQVLAVERESTPESQVHRSGKGWGGAHTGLWHNADTTLDNLWTLPRHHSGLHHKLTLHQPPILHAP